MNDPNAIISVVAPVYTPSLMGMTGQVMVASLWQEVRPPSRRWRTRPVARAIWRLAAPPARLEVTKSSR